MSTTFFTATPEQLVRARSRAVWESGDLGLVLRHAGEWCEAFIDRLQLGPGCRVLEVACGTGEFSENLGRTGCCATGLDCAQSLLDRARRRRVGGKAGGKVEWVEGDPRSLPFPDRSFDAVVSAFGAAYVERGGVLVPEMVRVCRPGGRLAWTAWTPDGVFGDLSRVLVEEGWMGGGEALGAFDWGSEAQVRAWVAAVPLVVEAHRRRLALRFPFPPGRVAEFLRQFFGPVSWASSRLNAADRLRLAARVADRLTRANAGPDGTTVLEVDYLEVAGIRQ